MAALFFETGDEAVCKSWRAEEARITGCAGHADAAGGAYTVTLIMGFMVRV